MLGDMDLATALDFNIADASIDAKFRALKTLQARKIKSLMNVIDTREKDIARLKTVNKDNNRTKIIQSLKKKVRDHELVADVLKIELQNKAEMSRYEVNEFVIRKTVGGPKRFRPLTREELENLVAEAEKKSKVRASHDVDRTADRVDISDVRMKRQERALTPATSTKNDSNDANLGKIAELSEELNSVKKALDVKTKSVTELKNEVMRLRARNAELVALEDELDIAERRCVELQNTQNDTNDELQLTIQQLSSTQEELYQVRSEKDMAAEHARLELEGLRDMCEKSMKQNAVLLKRMADIESGRLDLTEKSLSRPASRTELSIEEYKLQELQRKLEEAEARLKDSEARPPDDSAVRSLTEKLREKNETIRELKRSMAELNRLRGSASAEAKGTGSDDDNVVVRLADCLVELQISLLKEDADADGEQVINLSSLSDCIQEMLTSKNTRGLSAPKLRHLLSLLPDNGTLSAPSSPSKSPMKSKRQSSSEYKSEAKA